MEAHGRPHRGRVRTWKNLQRLFPGHTIPFSLVCDVLDDCVICQKTMLDRVKDVRVPPRMIVANQIRAETSVDYLEVSPASPEGWKGFFVFKNLLSKVITIIRVKGKAEEDRLSALVQFVSRWGPVHEFRCDPGGEFVAHDFRLLSKELGIHDIHYSIADEHKQSGAEGSNAQVLRQCRNMFLEFPERDIFDPSAIAIIEWAINAYPLDGVGFTPLQIARGDQTGLYSSFPNFSSASIEEQQGEYVKKIFEYLDLARKAAAKNIEEHRKEIAAQAALPSELTSFVAGDFVFFAPSGYLFESHGHLSRPGDKLDGKFQGPFEFVHYVSGRDGKPTNHAMIKSLIDGAIKRVDAARLSIFSGTPEQAKQLAMRDQRQYEVDRIINIVGDPLAPQSCTVTIAFADGEVKTLDFWRSDVRKTQQFVDFCTSHRHFLPLLSTKKDWESKLDAIVRGKTPHIAVGNECFSNLMAWSNHDKCEWYKSLTLPDKELKQYMVLGRVTRFFGYDDKNKRLAGKYEIFYPLFNEHYVLGDDYLYTQQASLLPDQIKLTPSLALEHLDIFPEESRRTAKKRLQDMINLGIEN